MNGRRRVDMKTRFLAKNKACSLRIMFDIIVSLYGDSEC